MSSKKKKLLNKRNF
jgi:hypothetical protein